jgi:FdhD protein
MNHTSITIKLSRVKNTVLDTTLEADKVILEEAITIQVVDAAKYTVLCTPSDIEALVIGFMFSQGIINDLDDIIKISDCQTGAKTITVQVKNFASSRDLDEICKPTDTTLSVTPADLNVLIEKLHAKQEIFKATGGAHAAGVFNSAKEIISFYEDIGRHNALDKAIGSCLLRKLNMRSCGVVLSSRISFEMVAKAARAGLEMIIAVSAPSSLAIEAAKKWNMTLCGFVRGKDANIYTGVERFSPLS